MARRRPRNRETERFVARHQASPLGIYGDDAEQKVMALIDAKDGDYFRPSLHPKGDEASSAWDNMLFTGIKTDLQRELVSQAKRHYGLEAPLPVPASRKPEPVAVVPVVVSKPAAKAEKYKEKKVEEVKEAMPEVVQDIQEDLLRRDAFTAGLLEDDDGIDDWLLAAAGIGLLGTGGVAGRATAPDEEEDS